MILGSNTPTEVFIGVRRVEIEVSIAGSTAYAALCSGRFGAVRDVDIIVNVSTTAYCEREELRDAINSVVVHWLRSLASETKSNMIDCGFMPYKGGFSHVK